LFLLLLRADDLHAARRRPEFDEPGALHLGLVRRSLGGGLTRLLRDDRRRTLGAPVGGRLRAGRGDQAEGAVEGCGG
jgi:hypothetical protein